MEDVIRRSVERQFPELSGKYHLPRFGRVVGIADAPADSSMCDDFRPRLAADIEVLREDGEPDPDLPILAGVPLPMPIGGNEMGLFGFPEEGTGVVVCFAYGLPHKPYIQAVLPHGLSLPKIPKGAQVWQHSESAQQRVDPDGSWLRQTDGRIRDDSIDREVQSLNNAEKHQVSDVQVETHSTESVGGIKKIEALGALKLLSGGSASLASIDDLHIASGRDLNLAIAQKLNIAVGGDVLERIKGARRSIAESTWLGSESVNALQVLCDLIDLVIVMNTAIATHQHGPSPVPNNSATFVANAETGAELLAKQISITGAA